MAKKARTVLEALRKTDRLGNPKRKPKPKLTTAADRGSRKNRKTGKFESRRGGAKIRRAPVLAALDKLDRYGNPKPAKQAKGKGAKAAKREG